MEPSNCHIVVISHASIKQINRSVYSSLKPFVKSIQLVIPASLKLSSGKTILAEPQREIDPIIAPLALVGQNPRTYYYQGLIEWLDKSKPQVILLENDPVSRLGFQLSAWCKRNNAKIICQTYENLKRDVSNTIRTQGWRAVVKNLMIDVLNKYTSKKIDALLVVNEASEIIFKGYGYRNVFRIPLGYDAKVFFVNAEKRTSYRKIINADENTVVVAYFGRLVPQKGVHLLIEALSNLKMLNWRLLIDHIHDSQDQYASSIRSQIISVGLEDRVDYFEADHFEIANYMRAADIMVAPSVTTPVFMEQYGRAVQEAMACGCVTVVSDSGHLKDLVQEDFLIFREKDTAKLTALLKRLIEDKVSRDLYRATLQHRAFNNLTIESQANKLLRLIQVLD